MATAVSLETVRFVDNTLTRTIDGIIWPLFHYHANDMAFEEEPWEAFVEVNKIFAQRVAKDLRDNDIIWVHDYHLMLVPQMLRKEIAAMKKPVADVKIGWFLHIPFPSSNEFFKLPYREEVLEGLLHSDLIGFHTYDYARHFLSSCSKALELETTPNGVRFNNRTVHVGAFPIGIDPRKEIEATLKPTVMEKAREYREKTFNGKSVIISVDRLDYIKGLPHKFHAFDMFLEKNKDMVGKVVLVQIIVPSRQDVAEYQVLHSHIAELAGRINAKYGNLEYQPIIERYCHVSHEELVVLYSISDVCLVTSTRDGMNLVSYEYIACHQKMHGQLVVSEFAGAAQSMKGCIVVNPWDTGDIMEALRKALNMTAKQKEENWKKMWEYVNKFTSENWGTSFVDELTQIGSDVSQSLVIRKSSNEESESVLLNSIENLALCVDDKISETASRMDRS